MKTIMEHVSEDPRQAKAARRLAEMTDRAWNDRPLPKLTVPAPLPVGSAKLYQMKVTLLGTDPPVWRRFVVPSFMKLAHLHQVLQSFMGWQDEHAFEFIINGAPFVTKDDYMLVDDRWKAATGYDAERYEVSQLFRPGLVFQYIYDFTVNWTHEIVVEHDHYNRNVKDPFFCLEGERACPPEDCGGPEGYAKLLAVMADPNHPEYKDKLSELGGHFNSVRFEPKQANRRMGVRSPSELTAAPSNHEADRKRKKLERQRKKEARKRKK